MILRAALWSLRLCPRRWELQVLGPLYIVCPCNSGSPGCTTAHGPISLQAALRVQWVMAPSATRCACKVCHPSASLLVRLLACCYSLSGSLQTVVAVQMHLLLVQKCTHCCPLSVCSSLTSAVNTINKMSNTGLFVRRQHTSEVTTPRKLNAWPGLWTSWHLWACWRLCLPYMLPAGDAQFIPRNSFVSAGQDLHLATTLDTLAWSVTLAFGASLGGAAVSKLGTTTCFLIDSATYVVAALCAWRLQVG